MYDHVISTHLAAPLSPGIVEEFCTSAVHIQLILFRNVFKWIGKLEILAA